MAMTKDEQARLQQLQEENEKLKAEKAQKESGANTPLVLPDPSMTPTIPFMETETVRIRLFKDEYRYKQPLYVSINGKNWLIKRGVEVEVPKYVADFISQLEAEDQRIWEKVAKEEEQYKQDTARLG